MRLRKFEITKVTPDHSGPGPERFFEVAYRAIINKKWVERSLLVTAKTESEARQKAQQAFGGIN